MVVKVAPSILSADFRNLEQEIRKVEQAGADLIHIDVMDGHFVPNITIGPFVVSAVRKTTKLPLDVHLMVENPDKYIVAFAKAGADIITIHVEASRNIREDIGKIKENQAKPGLVINPGTKVEKLFPYLGKIEMVLVMSVNPGFSGQKFMPEVLPKIKTLRKKILDLGLKTLDLEVDGGITPLTAPEVVKAGANVLVAGSAVFGAKDYKSVIDKLASRV